MRPEHAAHRGKCAVRQTFEQARMVPEFELDDVRLARQPRHLIEPVGDDDARAAGFDPLHIAALARLFEQKKVCSTASFGSAALMAAWALPTPPPRCGVTCRTFIPPPRR